MYICKSFYIRFPPLSILLCFLFLPGMPWITHCEHAVMLEAMTCRSTETLHNTYAHKPSV